MVLPLQMRSNGIIILKPLRALNTVVLAQTWQIDVVPSGLILREVLWVLYIGLDLVETSEVAARLRAGLLVCDAHFVYLPLLLYRVVGQFGGLETRYFVIGLW